MAIKQVRIGSMENVQQYDDTDYDAAIETDHTIRVGSAPTVGEDVLRLEDVGDFVGDVRGPAASTDNAVVRFDGATGKVIQDSGVTIDDSNNLSGVADASLNGAVIINESGANKDTRIEGDTDTHLFFVDASTDRVGIGVAAPSEKLDVDGDVNADHYKVSNTQVVTSQQAAISTPFQLGVGTPAAGTDTLDLSDLQSNFDDLNTNVQALAISIGSILTALRTHGLIDT
jgi:hypothetical protein